MGEAPREGSWGSTGRLLSQPALRGTEGRIPIPSKVSPIRVHLHIWHDWVESGQVGPDVSAIGVSKVDDPAACGGPIDRAQKALADGGIVRGVAVGRKIDIADIPVTRGVGVATRHPYTLLLGWIGRHGV